MTAQQILEPSNQEETIIQIEKLGLTRFNTIQPDQLIFLMNKNQRFTIRLCLQIMQLTGKVPRYFPKMDEKLGVRHWVKIQLY